MMIRSFFSYIYLFFRSVLRQFRVMLEFIKMKSRILFNEITKHAKVRNMSLRIHGLGLDGIDLIFLTPIVLFILYIWYLTGNTLYCIYLEYEISHLEGLIADKKSIRDSLHKV